MVFPLLSVASPLLLACGHLVAHLVGLLLIWKCTKSSLANFDFLTIRYHADLLCVKSLHYSAHAQVW
jgi:hypothetical protein